MHITEAAAQLRPGTAWNLREGKLEQSDDGSPKVEPPTSDELNILLASTAYRDLRAISYPSIGDQLDALWKGGQAAAEMLIKIQEVKTTYPKP